MNDPLDNPAWHALIGPHADLASGRGLARHYPRDVAPYSAVREASEAAWSDLLIDLPPGDVRLFRPREDAPPAGWYAVSANPILQMIMPAANLPDSLPREGRVAQLGPSDASDILALVETVRPGPFAPRTPLLGRYVGVRDERTGRLVAMGGERFRLDGFVELSAIAVSPEARGSGLGAAITASLARAAHRRGDTPFLHVYAANAARPLYERLGFRERTALWVLLWRRGGGA